MTVEVPSSRELTAFLRESLYLLTAFPLGIAGFTFAVTDMALAWSLLLIGVGLPLGFGFVYLHRALCDLDRRRAWLVTGRTIDRAYAVQADGAIIVRMWRTFRSPQSTRDVLWMLLHLPVGCWSFVVFTLAWSGIATMTTPFWVWAIPDDQWHHLWVDGVAGHFVTLIWIPIGAAITLLGIKLTSVTARGVVQMSESLLGPDMRERVAHLETTRSDAVDAANRELQRVERDLHDGAQARLVALSMDLGLAEQKLSSGDASRAAEHVAEAREQVATAMAELRDLVRGIGPSVLRDRGLDAALTALCAGRTPTVSLRIDVPEHDGEPSPGETAAYFVVAESLTNIAKHAQATHIVVDVHRAEDRLIAEVTDDGVGGADVLAGSGLSGLAKRVAALDGLLTVDSPAGAGTRVRAEIPG